MSKVFCSDTGKGPVVVLIHGFPLSHKIWKDVIAPLSTSFRVLAMDLPGFGSSDPLPAGFSIDQVAVEMLGLLKELHISSSTVVGHSLGGYVALSMVKHAPEMFSSLVLLHSTPSADSDEKKASRNKVLEFIERNGVIAFTGSFVPPLFADSSDESIDSVREIAVQSTTEAVTGYTKAMRDRQDNNRVLQEFHKPVLVIAGEKDSVIPAKTLISLKDVSPSIEVKVINGAGHMGMLEKPEEVVSILRDFSSSK